MGGFGIGIDGWQILGEYDHAGICQFVAIESEMFSQGLFSYQTWNGMDGFWQNGVILETMANAMHYLNFTRWK